MTGPPFVRLQQDCCIAATGADGLAAAPCTAAKASLTGLSITSEKSGVATNSQVGDFEIVGVPRLTDMTKI
jgi:hypothetical protein